MAEVVALPAVHLNARSSREAQLVYLCCRQVSDEILKIDA